MRYTEHRQFKLVVCTIRPREKLGIKSDVEPIWCSFYAWSLIMRMWISYIQVD